VLLDRNAPVAPARIARADGAVAVVSVGFGYSSRTGNKDFVYDAVKHAAAIDVASRSATLLHVSSQNGAALCFGDSGGPQYVGAAVVSVTSGGNTVCKGNATTTRLDSASARAFIAPYVVLPS
jgi:Trypsin